MFGRDRKVGTRVAAWLKPGQAVLDLGAGPGNISRWLEARTGVLPTLSDVVPFTSRELELPFVLQKDPFRVPVEDKSFDVVLILFVLHHVDRYKDQRRLLDEASRIARRRIIVMEPIPNAKLEFLLSKALCWAGNLRHPISNPFTFRREGEWFEIFEGCGLALVHFESFRLMWSPSMVERDGLFVLRPRGLDNGSGPGAASLGLAG